MPGSCDPISGKRSVPNVQPDGARHLLCGQGGVARSNSLKVFEAQKGERRSAVQRTLVVMVKEPRPGQVKTRLAREVGAVDAAWWYRHQVARLLSRVRDPRWQTVLAVSPDVEGMRSRVWPPRFARAPQGRGDIGARMARLLAGGPPGPVCVIGSDIPGVDRRAIARAFRALEAADTVFGPAEDGGFWLVGLKRVRSVPPQLFRGARWSSAYALRDALQTLPDHRVAFCDRMRDVDTIRDLAMTSSRRRASSAP
jgi:rSAM/selenodomain-associated transferase 1